MEKLKQESTEGTQETTKRVLCSINDLTFEEIIQAASLAGVAAYKRAGKLRMEAEQAGQDPAKDERYISQFNQARQLTLAVQSLFVVKDILEPMMMFATDAESALLGMNAVGTA